MLSKKPEAKTFKRWITSEIIPAILRTGSYTHANNEVIEKKLTHNQFNMLDEYNLHVRIVRFIRDYYRHMLLIVGLGENQTTPSIRMKSSAKGYRAGQPDLIILNKHKTYGGLAIEFKSPSGRGIVSDAQDNFLTYLQNNNFLTVISDNYEEIIMILVNYNNGILYKCDITGKYFDTIKKLESHKNKHLLAAEHITMENIEQLPIEECVDDDVIVSVLSNSANTKVI